jgi:hypothetical protein
MSLAIHWHDVPSANNLSNASFTSPFRQRDMLFFTKLSFLDMKRQKMS